MSRIVGKRTMRMQRMFVDNPEHTVKVTYLGKGKWGCRVLINGRVNQEIEVRSKEDIGPACREMLRWEDKCGNISQFASRSRDRQRAR